MQLLPFSSTLLNLNLKMDFNYESLQLYNSLSDAVKEYLEGRVTLFSFSSSALSTSFIYTLYYFTGIFWSLSSNSSYSFEARTSKFST